MTSIKITNLLLLTIALALVAIAASLILKPPSVLAQGGNNDPFYFEPGVYLLRIPNGGQVFGKVSINLRTGAIWGFPTNNSDPYPTSLLDSKQLVSHPVPLGRFALGETAGN